MANVEGEIASETPASYTVLSTANTVAPRYIAASLDNVIAMLLSVILAKSVGDGIPALPAIVLVVVYLAYFFIPEWLFSRTPGKLLTGLVVVGTDGERCTWRQTATRTAFRLLEVNPLLFGAVPAALSVVFSPYHQRFGDKLAKTLVVETRELRRHR